MGVLFDPLHDAAAGGIDASRSELILQGGSLTVDGVDGSPVKFTSSGLSKAPGDWYGLRIVDGDVTLRHFVVDMRWKGFGSRTATPDSTATHWRTARCSGAVAMECRPQQRRLRPADGVEQLSTVDQQWGGLEHERPSGISGRTGRGQHWRRSLCLSKFLAGHGGTGGLQRWLRNSQPGVFKHVLERLHGGLQPQRRGIQRRLSASNEWLHGGAE